MKVLESLKNQPLWPPLSSSKLPESKRQGDDESFKAREARLHLENVEILDETYVYRKYFGSSEVNPSGDFPTVRIMTKIIISNIKFIFPIRMT